MKVKRNEIFGTPSNYSLFWRFSALYRKRKTLGEFKTQTRKL